MDDLISRQAVKELAHNQMREKYCGMALKEQRDFYIKLADSIIDLLPSAEPEIIRCKDCKWGAQDEVGRWVCRSLGCQIGNEDGSGFCADAERRADNANANA